MTTNAVEPRHDAIDLRLEQWARWVRVGPARGVTSPMFRQYRAKRQYDDAPHIAQPLNTVECVACEKAVSMLPEGIRTAIRWHYVWPWVPVRAVRQELGATREGLKTMLDNGRDMLTNRLRR
jgi:hypothetical protein